MKSILKISSLLLLSFCFTSSVFAQAPTFKVTGSIADSAGVKLQQASMTVLKQGNNLLTGFGFSSREGLFEIKNIKAGDYVLQVTYVGKQTLRKPFTLVDKDVDLGKLILYNKVEEVATATITGDRNPITVKRDTLEYDAKAFQVRPNANVEELLKKLPGVEVDKDGKVTAMGKDVTKIRVDGKDFFGNDPKMATRNLDADIIDRVQVVDEKSDVSRFTGIDDGERDRVINLALKADKKKGYFGKLEGGYGTEDRYNNKINASRFNKKMQLSLVGNLNNDNKESFTRSDAIGTDGGMSFRAGGGGGGQGGQSGLSTAQSGGLNFSYDFSKKLTLNSSYFINRLINEQNKVSNQQQLLGANNSFRTAQNSDQTNENLNHRVNARINYKPSDKQEMIIRANVGFTNASLMYQADQKTFNASEVLSNEGTRKQESSNDNLTGSGQLTYRLKLGKVGRNLVFNAQANNNSTNQTSFLNTLDNYYTPTLPTSVLNQRQLSDNSVFNYQGTLTYTEPLTLQTLLEMNYTFKNNNNDQDRTVYDIVNAQDVLNTKLTNIYQNNYLYHLVGSKINYRQDKFNVNIGAKVQRSTLEGISQNNAPLTKEFTNVLPEANFNFSAPQNANLTLNYSTRVREPSVTQLQPVADNRDPQNIYIGNPNLVNEYSHSMNLNYFKFDMFSQTNIMAFASTTYTLHKISTQRTINSNFTQTSTPYNSDKQDWSAMAFANYGKPIRPLKIKFNLSLNTVFNRGYTFINQVLNQTDTYVNGVGLKIDNIRKETFDISVGTRLSQNTSKYSLNKDQNRSYLTPTYTGNLSLYLGKQKEWTLGTDMSYVRYPSSNLSPAKDIALWEASISRRILKDKGLFEIAGYDLLNQNVGYTRSESSTLISDERTISLGRYVMARFTYSFRMFGK
jgi:hypothetical protein